MIRRFEIYALSPDAPATAVRGLRRALQDCGRHIPEVLDSAIGTNQTDTPVQLAWEHAYESPAAYRRYMVHPFHASVIDRYVLADSPERITAHSGLGLGLVGYACDGPRYYVPGGLRRLVMLDLRAAGPGEVAAVAELARSTAGLAASVFAPNTMASTWFDGETSVGDTPGWTHVWEQAFTDAGALADHLARPGPAGEAERAGWQGVPGVSRAVVVCYPIEPGWGYGAGRGAP